MNELLDDSTPSQGSPTSRFFSWLNNLFYSAKVFIRSLPIIRRIKKEEKIIHDEIESLIVKPILKPKSQVLLDKITKLMMVSGVILIIISFSPSIYYWSAGILGINTNTRLLGDTASMALTNTSNVKINKSRYQPLYDPALPRENMISIPGTRIDTEIQETPLENYEDALRTGVWRVPNFSDPYDRKGPMILTAHRFGYLKWSVAYRLKNSFYQLPKTEVDDTVYVIWNQRKYTYAIYAEELGTEITDYTADLILYTCQDLNSEQRIIRYARLLEI